MKKLMLMLSVGIISMTVASTGYARPLESSSKGSDSKVAVQTSRNVVQAQKANGFTGDGADWWVVEQIIQTIKEFVGSHRP